MSQALKNYITLPNRVALGIAQATSPLRNDIKPNTIQHKLTCREIQEEFRWAVQYVGQLGTSLLRDFFTCAKKKGGKKGEKKVKKKSY